MLLQSALLTSCWQASLQMTAGCASLVKLQACMRCAKQRSRSALLQVIKDPKTGDALYWEPQWSWNHADPSISAVTPGCIPQSGPLPRTTAAGAGIFNHTEWPMYAGKAVPCEENSQVCAACSCFCPHQLH